MKLLINDVWEKILEVMQDNLEKVPFETWIKKLKPMRLTETRLELLAESSIHKNIADGRFINTMQKIVKEEFNADLEIVVFVDDGLHRYPGNSPKKDVAFAPALNPKYTFDTFIVGNSNRFAHAGALAVAEAPGTTNNPLFIYGGVGLGKTHLLHAIGNYIIKNDPFKKVLYISSETFTNDLIRSIGEKTVDEFKSKYRSVDVLMVDDIQFIAGKERTEEEFFHTFNTLYDSNKQIILTSDRPPKEIKKLTERLRSRFEWGLIGDLYSPDFETRVAILQQKADASGIFVSNDVLLYLAERITSNIRELEGVFNRIVAYRGLLNNEISIESVTQALKSYSSYGGSGKAMPEAVVEQCAKYYGITSDDIYGDARPNNIAWPRQVCMYILLSCCNMPKLRIAKFLNKDHSTIDYGLKKVKAQLDSNADLRAEIDNLKRDINS